MALGVGGAVSECCHFNQVFARIAPRSLVGRINPSEHFNSLRLQALRAIQNASNAQALTCTEGGCLHWDSALVCERVVANSDKPRWPSVGLHSQLQGPALRDGEQLPFDAVHLGGPRMGRYRARQAFMLLKTSPLMRVALFGQPP
jgi:hypothetical protein